MSFSIGTAPTPADLRPPGLSAGWAFTLLEIAFAPGHEDMVEGNY